MLCCVLKKKKKIDDKSQYKQASLKITDFWEST